MDGYLQKPIHHEATQNLVTCYINVWESNLVKLLVHVILCGESDWKLHSLINCTDYLQLLLVQNAINQNIDLSSKSHF